MLKKRLLATFLSLLFTVVLITGNVGRAMAADKSQEGTGQGEMAGQFEEQKSTYDAHRLYVKLHFDDVEMDFGFQWILGSIYFGGCEIGEGFYTAGQIKDGDPQSWQEAWEKLAQNVEKRADTALAAGHKVSARQSYLKASNYYRTAVVSMLPDNPKFKGLCEKVRSCFKKACPLFDPPMEYFEIPFEDTVLPGYYLKVDDSGQKRKTLIMLGGGETFAEELFFYIAPAAVERGYNFLTADIPGQGMMPIDGRFFRPDAEKPIGAILDFALSKPGVDPERLAMYGISGGGYFVPRAATVDKRIKYIVVNSAVIDQYALFSNMPNTKATPEEIAQWGAFKRATSGVVSWRWGLDPSDISGLAEANKGFDYDPAKVTCPALVLVGEGEYENEEVRNQIKTFLDSLPNPTKKFIMTKADQGASSHCIGENRSLMSEIVFDWLDETIK